MTPSHLVYLCVKVSIIGRLTVRKQERSFFLLGAPHPRLCLWAHQLLSQTPESCFNLPTSLQAAFRSPSGFLP